MSQQKPGVSVQPYILFGVSSCAHDGNRVTHKRTISTRFPNVTFTKAPIASPESLEMFSVAYVSKEDNGMTAMTFELKTITGFAWTK